MEAVSETTLVKMTINGEPYEATVPNRRLLVDFLVSERFQSELALNLFVYPANRAVELPQEFVDFAVVPDTSRTLDPSVIDAERSTWIDEWTELVLG